MSYLLNSIKNVNKAFADAGDYTRQADVGMLTGFTALDINTSNLETYRDEDGQEFHIMNGGLFNNPYTGLGMSAIGKTTFWIQAISSAMDYWYDFIGPVSECTFYNVENHTSAHRWKQVTGYTDQQMVERVRIIDKSLSINEIYKDIAILANEKLKHVKELEIDTGIVAISGERKRILPTSYVLIDSIASVRVETNIKTDKDGNIKFDGDGVAGTSNMDAMKAAKDNTIFINEVKKLCQDAKICVVMINHLVEVPVLDRYNPPKPPLPNMKYNEKFKGGNELVYQSFGVQYLTLKERMLTEKNKYYGDAVHGLVANCKLLKNKNGPEGLQYPMVFDYERGYMPELSDFETLYTEGMYGISGSPASYRLDILPEVSFTRKTLLEKCYSNPLLARAIAFTTRFKLINNVILRQDAPSLKEFVNLPYETRVYLILHYSVYYPAYVNRGYLVSGEDMNIYFKYHNIIQNAFHMGRPFDNDEVDFYLLTNGEYLKTGKPIGVVDCNIVKYNGVEYCVDENWEK